MKKTTKIILTLLIGGWLIIPVSFFIYDLLAESEQPILVCGDKMVSAEGLPVFHTVDANLSTASPLSKENGRGLRPFGNLYISRTEEDKPSFSYPEEMASILDYEVKDSVLFLTWNIDEIQKLERRGRTFDLTKIQINVNTPTPLRRVSAQLTRSFTSILQFLDQDSIHITQSSHVTIQKSKIRSVNVDNVWSFDLRESEAENLFVDLDRVQMWTVVSSKLQNEWLTGSSEHHVELTDGECERMHWKPKNESAKVNIKVGKAGTFVFD